MSRFEEDGGKRWETATKSLLAGFPVELRKDKASGYGLYASRQIAAGEVVIQERPYVMVVCESTKMRTCSHCFFQMKDDEEEVGSGGGGSGGGSGSGSGSGGGSAIELSVHCEQCQQQWYCSTTCKELSAKRHQQECGALAHKGGCGWMRRDGGGGCHR